MDFFFKKEKKAIQIWEIQGKNHKTALIRLYTMTSKPSKCLEFKDKKVQIMLVNLETIRDFYFQI